MSTGGALPPKPVGTGSEATFAQWVYYKLTGEAVESVPGALISRTTRGISIKPTAAGNSAQARPAGMYKLKSVQDDYVTARSWDGTTEGTADVLIAKEYKLRCSIASETILGVANTYTYADGGDALNKVRTHTRDAATQAEIVVPVWTPDEIIHAIKAKTGVNGPDTKPLTLLLLRSGQWAKKP
jgi:hypothetical protein